MSMVLSRPDQISTAPPPEAHPLDPLSPQEMALASRLVRESQQLAPTAHFILVTLAEPSKDVALTYQSGMTIDRTAFVIVREVAERRTYEALVSLSQRRVLSWQHIPDVQPLIKFEEFFACENAVRAHPDWQAAMLRRGITDFSLTMVDPWSTGYNGPEDAAGLRRIARPLTWVRNAPDDHGYARPVEGLVVLVDLDSMTVLEVVDHGIVPLPPKAGNYTVEGIADPNNSPYFPAGVRTDLKPITITQPEGPSFTVEGNQVRWQKWHMRIGFTAREGLVLYTIGYEDKGTIRPIIYRASLSEMFIPYGDPNPTHYRKNVFDMGEYGVGLLANSLQLGCDCLGEIRYFDATINDIDGNPVTLHNAICMHEEDYGILWKHTDFRTEHVEVRRSRRLVISFIATVGNYEYGFFWYFYQDGTIQYEVKLSGVISTGAVAPDVKPRYGTLVAPGLYGPNHQHFFNVRLDMCLDGDKNSVYEVNSHAVPPGDENPHGNAWVAEATLLATEQEAQRTIDPLQARYWKIVNPNVTNAMGDLVAYKLMPGDNVLPFYQPDAYALKRAGFATKHLWVTPFNPAEMYAAGDYPNQHPGGAGLPAYTQANRSTENTDLVVWYTFGAHHIPRPEDWPVMPVSYIGFHLKPVGFFDGNPSLDVAPSPPAHHCCS